MFSICSMVTQMRSSGASSTCSGFTQSSRAKLLAPIRATAAPSTKLLTRGSVAGPPALQRRGQAGPAQGFDKAEIGRAAPPRAGSRSRPRQARRRQPAGSPDPAHGQADREVPPQRWPGLRSRRDRRKATGNAPPARRTTPAPRQASGRNSRPSARSRTASPPKTAGLVDLLLRRGDRHEDRAVHAEMAAGIGHALGVVARRWRRRTGACVGIGGPHLAHRREGTAQLVAAHRAQVFALEPDFGTDSVATGDRCAAAASRERDRAGHGWLGGRRGRIRSCARPYRGRKTRPQGGIGAATPRPWMVLRAKSDPAVFRTIPATESAGRPAPVPIVTGRQGSAISPARNHNAANRSAP